MKMPLERNPRAIQRDTATVSSVVVTNLKTVFRKGGVDRVEVNILTFKAVLIDERIEEGMVRKVWCTRNQTSSNIAMLERSGWIPLPSVGTTDSMMGLPKELTEKLLKEALTST
ncbi:hypothetical protein DY000_02013213 [Brassica cretica]|uniref:Uncharacterized protein n=1 Tax=Brassica cretica TaxID=69181 RepID=A0ABQ7CZS3_BRACR|nr:hypothetical protein DY000_02013213 [Brassica cretica]